MKEVIKLNTMERLLQDAGIQRVSAEAKIVMRDALSEYAENLARKARKNMIHAGRKTVKASDILLAKKTE